MRIGVLKTTFGWRVASTYAFVRAPKRRESRLEFAFALVFGLCRALVVDTVTRGIVYTVYPLEF
jgi:hypothetical protein